MSIELLWLIPIVAFGFFLFLIAFLAQKRETDKARQEDPLVKEVAMFNAGGVPRPAPDFAPSAAEFRLGEIEQKIGALTASLSDQQRVIDKFQKENTAYTQEVSKLKKKLRGLHKEYDLVLSENYSLRARVKSLRKNSTAERNGGAADRDLGREFALNSPTAREMDIPAMDMRIYEDTRVMKALYNDETGEVDLADLK